MTLSIDEKNVADVRVISLRHKHPMTSRHEWYFSSTQAYTCNQCSSEIIQGEPYVSITGACFCESCAIEKFIVYKKDEAVNEIQLTPADTGICICPKEVWMVVGCKCGAQTPYKFQPQD